MFLGRARKERDMVIASGPCVLGTQKCASITGGCAPVTLIHPLGPLRSSASNEGIIFPFFPVSFLLKYDICTEIVSEHSMNFHTMNISLKICTWITKQNITNTVGASLPPSSHCSPSKGGYNFEHSDSNLILLILNFI